MCGVGKLSAPIAIMTYGWSETGFFCENTSSQPAATAKTRFLGFTGGQKYGWSETGFLARILGYSSQQRQKPGFFGLVSLVLMGKSPD